MHTPTHMADEQDITATVSNICILPHTWQMNRIFMFTTATVAAVPTVGWGGGQSHGDGYFRTPLLKCSGLIAISPRPAWPPYKVYTCSTCSEWGGCDARWLHSAIDPAGAPVRAKFAVRVQMALSSSWRVNLVRQWWDHMGDGPKSTRTPHTFGSIGVEVHSRLNMNLLNCSTLFAWLVPKETQWLEHDTSTDMILYM